jgi:BolA protein
VEQLLNVKQLSVQQSIIDDLEAALAPQYLSVDNESAMHNVPPGSQSHFKVVIVSAEFDGMRRVARHQRIYGLLRVQLDGAVHALALHTYSPQEWEVRSESAPQSPDCLGGSGTRS